MAARGIRIFRDEEELPPGKTISEILGAIKSSQIYISIFSKNYASSKWCLRELACMVQWTCQSIGKEILPIFYDVDPSDVKLQTELYKSDLTKHEDLGCIEVKLWKEALTMVAGIKGWHLKDQREGKVLKDIVQKVLQKIPTRNRYFPSHLVGIDDHVENMMAFFNRHPSGEQFFLIRGKRGSGTTTLAKAVFNALSPQFECRSFLANIRESSSCGGIEKMQRKIVADLLSFSLPEAFDFEEGNNVIRSGSPHKRVFLVFDDISDDDRFIQLVEIFCLCGPGSRIIFTSTRGENFFWSLMRRFRKNTLELYMYQIVELKFDHAIQLFNKLAFNADSAPPDLYDLSREVVGLLGGLPLALEVFASHLRGREKLKEVPHKNVQQKLQIIYDASFFVYEKKTNAMCMWEALHDQLRDLGRQIICQGDDRQLGDRSRLWFPETALDIVQAKQVDNCGSSKWIDLKPSLHAGEVICGLINEKKALENNIEGIESQLKVSEEKVHILQKQLERSKRKNNKIQTEVSQLEAKEKIYLRGIVALIGLVCVMLLLK